MNHLRSILLRGGVLAALSIALALPAGAAIELTGTNQATFEWRASEGPVAGYKVWVVTNDGEPFHLQTVASNTATVAGRSGDSIKVSVSPFDGAGNDGPMSRLSTRIIFLAEAPPPPTPPTDDPRDPPGDDPIPNDQPPAEGSGVDLDFDGDGRADILLRNERTEQAEIWTMKGRRVRKEMALPDVASELEIVGNEDYDGDGFADALCFDESTGMLEVWLLQGADVIGGGELEERVPSDFRVVGAGDYDGNGRGDVLLWSSSAGMIEIWSLDAGRVLEISEIEAQVPEGWELIGSGDFDGNGQTDILWRNALDGRTDAWLLAGETVEEVSLLEGDDDAKQLAAIGDFDGNGHDDIALRGAASGLTVVLVEDGVVVDERRVDKFRRRRLPERRVVGTGDYNGDGRTDLLVDTGRTPKIYFMRGTRTPRKFNVPKPGEGWYFAGVEN